MKAASEARGARLVFAPNDCKPRPSTDKSSDSIDDQIAYDTASVLAQGGTAANLIASRFHRFADRALGR